MNLFTTNNIRSADERHLDRDINFLFYLSRLLYPFKDLLTFTR